MSTEVVHGEVDSARPCALHPGRMGTWYDNDTFLCAECKAKMAVISDVKPTVAHLSDADRECVGIFIHHAINHLWYASPDAAPDGYQPPANDIGDYAGCCPRCCGPCYAIARLRQNGQLDEWVRCWAEDTNASTAWWNADFGLVDRGFLNRAWANADALGCHP